MLTEADKKILSARDRKKEYDRQRYTKRLELIAAAEQRANEEAKQASDDAWAEKVYDRLVVSHKLDMQYCGPCSFTEFVNKVYGSLESALERSQQYRTPQSAPPTVPQRKQTAAERKEAKQKAEQELTNGFYVMYS